MLDEQLPHIAKILDVGCGTGQMTNFLGLGWGRTVIGADLCVNSLKLARAFRDRLAINNAHFVQANLFRPPFAPAGFDAVIANGVLQHAIDCRDAFRSIAQLVRPGGAVIVGLYNWLGRLPALWWRSLVGNGDAAMRGRRLRGYPLETRHSMDEVMEWFKAEGFDFTASIPTIGDVEFSDRMPLFEVQPVGSRLDRLSSEIELLLTGGGDGGHFIMIGRKRQ